MRDPKYEHITLIDTGGQRNERKKWPAVTSQATCVIYVMNLNGYMYNLRECQEQNALLEDFELFEKTINDPTLAHKPFFVFLNQKDVFEKNMRYAFAGMSDAIRLIQAVLLEDLAGLVVSYCDLQPFPLSAVLPDYTDGAHTEHAIAFIRNKLESLDRRQGDIPLMFFTTDATNDSDVQPTFETIFEALTIYRAREKRDLR